MNEWSDEWINFYTDGWNAWWLSIKPSSDVTLALWKEERTDKWMDVTLYSDQPLICSNSAKELLSNINILGGGDGGRCAPANNYCVYPEWGTLYAERESRREQTVYNENAAWWNLMDAAVTRQQILIFAARRSNWIRGQWWARRRQTQSTVYPHLLENLRHTREGSPKH